MQFHGSAHRAASGEPLRAPAAREVLDLVGLTPLMGLTSGRPDVVVGVIDGPIALNHARLAPAHVQALSRARTHPPGGGPAAGEASVHGTFVAGLLWGRRDGGSAAICPDCSFVVHEIFSTTNGSVRPSATPTELADAVVGCVNAGAHVINVSAGVSGPSLLRQPELLDALTFAMARGTLVVVAAGNEPVVGGSALTRHPGVIPVLGCTRAGLPLGSSTLGWTVGRHGLAAPGEDVTSLHPDGGTVLMVGSSVAVPFVTGSIALLLSLLPGVRGEEVRFHLRGGARRRTSIIPPLLDAWASYTALRSRYVPPEVSTRG